MSKSFVERVKNILGRSGVTGVVMESEEDLNRWLQERKHYRDLNRLELAEVEEQLDLLCDQEEKELKNYRTSEPNSMRRRRCLEKINSVRKQVKSVRELKILREQNIEINSNMLIEIEKSRAVSELGMSLEQSEMMRDRFEQAVEKYLVTSYSANGADWATTVTKDDSELDELERELEAIAPEDAGDELAALERTLEG